MEHKANEDDLEDDDGDFEDTESTYENETELDDEDVYDRVDQSEIDELFADDSAINTNTNPKNSEPDSNDLVFF